jgi:unsaturated chondroitin disaccharide hydrolase
MRSQALAGLLRRIEQTGRTASGRFPMFADSRSGEWTWRADDGWADGFWPGLLWLAEAATGERAATRSPSMYCA